MSKLKYVRDVFCTLVFNFRVLPFKKAIKLPFFIGHTYRLFIEDYRAIKLDVPLNEIKRFMVRFANGGSIDVVPRQYGVLAVLKGGELIFTGDCQFNAGCSLRVEGAMKIGNGVHFNRNCSLSCMNSVYIGDRTLFGFNCSVRDSDGHTIIRSGKKRINNMPIFIGEHNWFCANSTINKGTIIGCDNVVAANSVVKGTYKDHSLIVGMPGKVVDDDVSWLL